MRLREAPENFRNEGYLVLWIPGYGR
jgi:hypothetical protein